MKPMHERREQSHLPNSNPQAQLALSRYQGLHRQLQTDIIDTNKEIHNLNSKIFKNDYDHGQLRKLQSQHYHLLQKRRELQQAIANQQIMQQEMALQRHKDKNYQYSLANEYSHLSQEKRRRAEEQRQRQLEAERQHHEFNRRAIEEDYFRKRQGVEEQRKIAQEELALRQQIRAREKAQRQRQKHQYNQIVQIRNHLQTQKDTVYKQYYNQVLDNQSKLQGIYNKQTAPVDRQREEQRDQFQRKEIQQFHLRIAQDQKQRARRMTEQKDMLRSFLQTQIEQKHRRQTQERQQELNYQQRVSRHLISNAEAEQLERFKRKEEQRRYDQELKEQTNRSSRVLSLPSPGVDGQGRHNPITNPISFKIGHSNPYVIREYQTVKGRELGDPNQLKLRNLALNGSTSLPQPIYHQPSS